MVYLKVRAMKFTALLVLPKYTGLNFHLSSPLLSFHPRYEIHQSQVISLRSLLTFFETAHKKLDI